MEILLGMVYLFIAILITVHTGLYVYLPREKTRLDKALGFAVVALTGVNLLIAGLQLMAGNLYLPNGIDGFILFSTANSILRICVSVVGITLLYLRNIRRGR